MPQFVAIACVGLLFVARPWSAWPAQCEVENGDAAWAHCGTPTVEVEASSSGASSCARQLTLMEALQQAGVAFAGRVTGFELREDRTHTIRLEVATVWKGLVPAQVVVVTDPPYRGYPYTLAVSLLRSPRRVRPIAWPPLWRR